MPIFTAPDHCRIFFKPAGPASDGRTVVFLNGLSQTALYWHSHARALAPRYPSLGYDARAQGQSDTGGRPLTPALHAEDLARLLDHLGIAEAVLVGLSHGAHVACAFAAASPDRVAGLVLSGAALNWNEKRFETIADWEATLENGGLEALARKFLHAAFGRTFLQRHHRLLPIMTRTLTLRNRVEALTAQLSALHAYPPLSAFTDAITAPAMVLWGDEDRLVERDGARGLAERLDAEWIPLAGIGHSLPIEAPDAFQRHLIDFLAKLDAPPPG